MAKAAPQKYFEEQFDDEEMLLLFRKHPVVMRKQLVIASVLLLVGIVPAFIATYIPKLQPVSMQLFLGGLAVGFLLAGIVMFFAWMSWHFSVFIVTSQRFIQIAQKGLFHRSFVDIGLDKIQMINYEVAGFQESLLGFGTILIQTYVGDLVIHDVHHPRKIQRKLSHILRELDIETNRPPME